MKHMLRRFSVLGMGGALLLVTITGCTLTGANAAPLTPVGPGTGDGGAGSTFDQVTPTDVGVPDIPSPTPDTGPIDVFGTQTAIAPLLEETVDSGLVDVTPDVIESPIPPEVSTQDVVTQEPVPGTPTPQPSAEDCPETHTVQPGENLFRIALKYGITVDELVEANGITNPDKVQAGTVLKIPGCKQTAGDAGGTGDQTYVVQPGDTLYSIALKFGVGWKELAAYNDITNPDLIYVGQVLKIPPKS